MKFYFGNFTTVLPLFSIGCSTSRIQFSLFCFLCLLFLFSIFPLLPYFGHLLWSSNFFAELSQWLGWLDVSVMVEFAFVYVVHVDIAFIYFVHACVSFFPMLC